MSDGFPAHTPGTGVPSYHSFPKDLTAQNHLTTPPLTLASLSASPSPASTWSILGTPFPLQEYGTQYGKVKGKIFNIFILMTLK